jgi:hypothetical protein
MIINLSGKQGSGKDTVGAIINYLTCCNSFWRHKKEVPEQFTFELFNSSDYTGVLGRGDFKIKKYSDKLKDMTCILIGCTREQLEDQDFKATPLGEEWKQTFTDDYDLKDNKLFDKDYGDFQEDLTPRKILQLLGTDFGRDMIHPDVWINSLFADYHSGIKMSDYTESKWIITDSRFPNDVERVKSLGGICIRVNRNPKHIFTKDGIDYIQENKDPWYYNINGKHYKDRKHYNDLIPMKTVEHESETSLDNYEGFDYIIDNNFDIQSLIEKVKEILIKENII